MKPTSQPGIRMRPTCATLLFSLAIGTGLGAHGAELPPGNRESALAVNTDPERLKRFERIALTDKGDLESGRRLFADEQRTRCMVCHRVKSQGGEVGPDLTQIGGKFDRPHLIESLLEPSRQIVEGFRTSVVVTKDGKSTSGIVRARDETRLTIWDAQNRSRDILLQDVAEEADTGVSLMPADLTNQLSSQEFTDLIAYLESLRSGDGKFGSGVSGPIRVPEGFEVATIATGLTGATALEVLADGRVLICEQIGALRVVKNGQLLPEPILTVPVDHYWERGLIGVTVSPGFPDDPWVYLVYVAKDPYPHHRVSRYRFQGDKVIAGSEDILLRGDDQRALGGNVPAGHQGGAIHFGPDGKLYIGIGDQTANLPAQKLNTLQGKILRIHPDGTIPPDNPFLNETTGKYQSIWAIGCRNPFTFAIQRPSGTMLINDVGGKFEEINRGSAGANFGWPMVEHGEAREGVTAPIHFYPQASISGGAFLSAPASWPTHYHGRYFFADFVHGWIKTLHAEDPSSVADFASGFRRPVDLRFGPDGSLFVLLRNAWVIDDKFAGGTGSLLRVRPKS